jgi:TolA-binding protein
MRKLLIFLVIVMVFGLWFRDYVRSGRFDRSLDQLPYPAVKAPFEYYLGMVLSLANQDQSALNRFERVTEKYPKTEYAPLALAERINILDRTASHEQVLDESRKFVKDFPDHPAAHRLRRKIEIIENVY